jgi:hypothetical protein
LIERFQQRDVGDHRGMPDKPDIIASMKELLEALDAGTVPNDADYSLDDLAGYVTSLVEGQRESLGRTMPGSWAVVPDDAGMDAEMRVEYIFVPTCIATATLSRCLCDHPLTALAIPGAHSTQAEHLGAKRRVCSSDADVVFAFRSTPRRPSAAFLNQCSAWSGIRNGVQARQRSSTFLAEATNRFRVHSW